MEIPKKITNSEPALSEWAVITAYRGSIAHNMYIPSNDPNSIDDKDIMSICIPPLEYYFGLEEFGSRGTKEIFSGEWDIVIYEYKKFVALLKKGNPNVLSLLWLKKEHYIFKDEIGDLLIENRNIFVGKHVFESFIGYAKSQFHKMEHFAFQGYMGQKRKTMVQKYGYDTKNAAHLIRLVRMCIEFLNEGRLIVFRPDREELLSIKCGQWSLEKVKKEALDLFQKAEQAYNKSPLPESANLKAINDLCIYIGRTRLGIEFNKTNKQSILF